MKATEQRIQAYLKKIGETNKINLEKVELSEARAKKLINDFKRAANEIKSGQREIEKFVQQIKEADKLKDRALNVLNEFGETKQLYLTGKDQYNRVIDKIVKDAKELGVDHRKIPYVKELERAFNDAGKVFVNSDRASDELRKFVFGR